MRGVGRSLEEGNLGRCVLALGMDWAPEWGKPGRLFEPLRDDGHTRPGGGENGRFRSAWGRYAEDAHVYAADASLPPGAFG